MVRDAADDQGCANSAPIRSAASLMAVPSTSTRVRGTPSAGHSTTSSNGARALPLVAAAATVLGHRLRRPTREHLTSSHS